MESWRVGELESWRVGELESGRIAQLPITNAQCPMPNAQCPMPNAQFPQHSSVKSVKSLTVRVAELPSRIKFQKEVEFACEF